jgi:hypothetical protein
MVSVVYVAYLAMIPAMPWRRSVRQAKIDGWIKNFNTAR